MVILTVDFFGQWPIKGPLQLLLMGVFPWLMSALLAHIALRLLPIPQ